MQGKNGCAVPIFNPVTNSVTKYMFSGNACNRTGWLDNQMNDRRQMLSTGPIVMNSGDTQTILAAVMVGRGANNYQSVCRVQYLSDTAKMCYNYNFMLCPELIGINPIGNEVPYKFMLYQNYPNPFNPATTIRFSVGTPSEQVAGSDPVKLTLYDALGREIKTLVNENLKPGTYEVEWDATNYPSGIYFYQLSTTGYNQTRRMVLIK
jgi:hypothetical protein